MLLIGYNSYNMVLRDMSPQSRDFAVFPSVKSDLIE